jgi:hypothetical protein
MVQAVRDLPREIQAMMTVREWDMRTPDAHRYFKQSRIKKLPSIAVNGEVMYASLMPDQDELIETIASAYKGGAGKRP